MRIHPLCLLICTILVIVKAIPSRSCQFNVNETTGILDIRDCDSPLALSKDKFNNIPTNITLIQFSNIAIEKIDENTFTDFNFLSNIIFNESTINDMNPEAFFIPELHILKFSKTTFKTSPEFNSQYLQELILKECQLTKIPTLDSLPGLIFLNLDGNFISKIEETDFSKLHGLEELQIPNNLLTDVATNAFQNNIDLVTINMDNNPLAKINFNFPKNLEILSLNHCTLNSFDANAARKFSTLKTLFLKNNEISVLPIDTFESMTELDTIDLSGNKLVELDDDIFAENNIDTIILDNNPLEKLPNFKFRDNVRITIFSCKNCKLHSLKNVFNLTPIVKLDLSHNNLTDVSDILNIEGLMNLNLENNEIRNIQINTAGTDLKIQRLNLANNPLVPLDPVAFNSMPSLKTLNVTNCNLEKLWANYNSNLRSLEALYIAKNGLTKLSVKDLKIAPSLKIVDWQENPLVCPEEDFIMYLMKNPIYAATRKSEDLRSSEDNESTQNDDWQSALPSECSTNDDFLEEKTDNNDVSDEIDDNYNFEDDAVVEASVITTEGFNLANASYVLAFTSVFILTALLVLFVAVVITLLILKKNKSLNRNCNLPRFKIPLWHGTSGQKKHSGSVYRPLSEEFGSSISQYHFTQTPQVHNSLP